MKVQADIPRVTFPSNPSKRRLLQPLRPPLHAPLGSWFHPWSEALNGSWKFLSSLKLFDSTDKFNAQKVKIFEPVRISKLVCNILEHFFYTDTTFAGSFVNTRHLGVVQIILVVAWQYFEHAFTKLWHCSQKASMSESVIWILDFKSSLLPHLWK